MTGRKKLRLALIVLAVSHGSILLAGFFAPYGFATQNRELPFAPPVHIHFIDEQKTVHLRPFIYRLHSFGNDLDYREDRSRMYPIRFLVAGAPYMLLGSVPCRWHLFGVDEPARIFLIGSDAYGRDQFSRLLYGGQISLFAGLLATVISLSAGTLLGAIAGFYGGWIDEIIMRIAEIFFALPWLYLLFAVRAFLPLQIAPNQIFLLLIAVIGIIGWARPARLIRGVVLSAREKEYVLAAKGFGASDLYLLRRHVLPQALGIVWTQAMVFIPRYILAEVVLSFFGLGVSEPFPSWGNMLAALREYQVLETHWWMFFPTLALIPISMAYHGIFSHYVHRSVPRSNLSSSEFFREASAFVEKA